MMLQSFKVTEGSCCLVTSIGDAGYSSSSSSSSSSSRSWPPPPLSSVEVKLGVACGLVRSTARYERRTRRVGEREREDSTPVLRACSAAAANTDIFYSSPSEHLHTTLIITTLYCDCRAGGGHGINPSIEPDISFYFFALK